MAKTTAQYVLFFLWSHGFQMAGKMQQCQEWNTFEESVVASNDRPGTKGISNVKKATPTLLTDVDMSDGEVRLKTGIGLIDRVLGGGLVTGSFL